LCMIHKGPKYRAASVVECNTASWFRWGRFSHTTDTETNSTERPQQPLQLGTIARYTTTDGPRHKVNNKQQHTARTVTATTANKQHTKTSRSLPLSPCSSSAMFTPPYSHFKAALVDRCVYVNEHLSINPSFTATIREVGWGERGYGSGGFTTQLACNDIQ
jgi:hypothetical protein